MDPPAAARPTRRAAPVGHGCRPIGCALVEGLESPTGDRRLAAGRAQAELQHQRRVALGRYVDTQFHLAVAQRDARCERAWLDRFLLGASHGLPGPIELPRQRACRGRHRGHQIVGSLRIHPRRQSRPGPRDATRLRRRARLGGARLWRAAACRRRPPTPPGSPSRCHARRRRSSATRACRAVRRDLP